MELKSLPLTSITIDNNAIKFLFLFIAIACFIFFINIKFGVLASLASETCYRLLTKLIWNVLRRRMRFFDTTASGVIQNRCTDDVEIIDMEVSDTLVKTSPFLIVFSSTMILSIVITPLITTPLFLLAFVLSYIVRIYLTAGVELLRLSRVSLSPLLTKVSEMMNGATTLRHYGYMPKLLQQWEKHHDLNLSSLIHEIYCRVWCNHWINLSCSALISLSFLFVVTGKFVNINFVTDSVSLGLILTSMITLADYLSLAALFLAKLGSNISAIERVEAWVLEEDYEDELDKRVLNSEWPEVGYIQFDKVRARYREGLPFVLDGLSFEVSPGEKVALVGRTGSGKSTTLLCLMRILELVEGKIEIDGQDIRKLGLHELRQNLVIIPQDPYLFQGTLRSNLDPYGLNSEIEIINTLDSIHVFESLTISENGMQIDFESKSNFLAMRIEEKGSNLSLGQRQLICIARALIRKPKILLIDEATASIDQKTDAIIQEVIKNRLEGVSVLTIAHRLITVIQYDKIVMLERGRKIEEGSPLALMIRDSEFNSGEEHKRKLVAIASPRGQL